MSGKPVPRHAVATIVLLWTLSAIGPARASEQIADAWINDPTTTADFVQHVVSVFAHPTTSAVYAAGHTDAPLQNATNMHLDGQPRAELPEANGFVLKYFSNGGLSLPPLEIGTERGDHAHAVTGDATSVYVVGHTNDTAETAECPRFDSKCDDIFVMKLTLDLEHVWTARFESVPGGFDIPEAIAVDSAGVYVAGFTAGNTDLAMNATPADAGTAFVRKIDKGSGALVWEQLIGTTGFNAANGVAADASGVYVSGQRTVVPQSGPRHFDAYVTKRDPTNGSELWTTDIATGASLPVDDVANGVTVNASGVYVGGRVAGNLPGYANAGGFDAFVGKLDSANGDELWMTQFGTSKFDEAFAITAHPSGIHVAGQACGEFGESTGPCATQPGALVDPARDDGEAFVARFDFAGDHLSSRVLVEMSSEGNEHALGITLNPRGKIYVAGFRNSPAIGHGERGICDGFVLGMDLIRTFTAVQNGQWHDPATWGGSVPGVADTKVVPSGITVRVTQAMHNSGVIANEGTISGAGSSGNVIRNAGTISNLGNIVLVNTAGSGIDNLGIIANNRIGLLRFPPTNVFSKIGFINVRNAGSIGITNVGAIVNHGLIQVANTEDATVGVNNGGTISNHGIVNVSNTGDAGQGIANVHTIDNNRTITIRNSAGIGLLNNHRITNTANGTIRVANTAGTGLRNVPDNGFGNSGRVTNSGVVGLDCVGTYTGDPPIGNPVVDLCDQTPPTIIVSSLTAPADGFLTTQNSSAFPATVGTSPITVRGTVGDDFGIESVLVNGVTATLVGDSWTATDVVLAPGANALSVTASDTSNNETTTSVEVLLNRDLDADGIENNIDGDCSGPSPTSEATTASSRFCDELLTGKLAARIVSKGPGLSMTLRDATPNPAEGVVLALSGPADQVASIRVDGSAGRLDFGPGGPYVLSDPDLTTRIEVAEGRAEAAFVINGAPVSIVIESGEEAQMSETTTNGKVRLTVTALRGTITVNGFPLAPGQSLPVPLPVGIDIKPGSYPNSINAGSGGTVPVAILSSATFDATTVNPTTVTLASAPVRLRGKGTAMATPEDVDGDGRLDLVVHISTEALELSETDTEAVLEGLTFGGIGTSSMPIRGVDSVRVVRA